MNIAINKLTAKLQDNPCKWFPGKFGATLKLERETYEFRDEGQACCRAVDEARVVDSSVADETFEGKRLHVVVGRSTGVGTFPISIDTLSKAAVLLDFKIHVLVLTGVMVLEQNSDGRLSGQFSGEGSLPDGAKIEVSGGRFEVEFDG